ncbi:phage protein Gp36 family protein [Flavobacterium gelatinilyticum]|uniref:phage protein Gp36 family protein n=1 Tax=Flavobacterium gelatinilyticum TaxID=3003260 RepID=UPI0024813A16|nr:phage protein Gp36 family protein [Flavobacterium gelatinilyticum]
MFIEKEDLGSTIYDYQIDQITEGDEGKVDQAINAAVEEAKSYLTPNINNKKWLDGRHLYDVENIFNKTGTDRHTLIVRQCATMAKWYLAELCNADFIYEKAKERYDRAVTWFTKVAKGEINVSTLPLLPRDEDTAGEKQPFEMGSRAKFNHDY